MFACHKEDNVVHIFCEKGENSCSEWVSEWERVKKTQHYDFNCLNRESQYVFVISFVMSLLYLQFVEMYTFMQASKKRRKLSYMREREKQ